MDWTGKRVLSPGFYDFFLDEIGKRPGNYMETGVFEGWGLRELALKYPDRMFYGVDPFIEDGYTSGHSGVEKGGELSKEHDIAHQNLNLSNVVLLEVTSAQVLWRFDDVVSYGIKFFFVDGQHDYDTAQSDLTLALASMPNGGVIGMDDLGVEGVNEARVDFLRNMGDRALVSNRHVTTPGDLIYIKPL